MRFEEKVEVWIGFVLHCTFFSVRKKTHLSNFCAVSEIGAKQSLLHGFVIQFAKKARPQSQPKLQAKLVRSQLLSSRKQFLECSFKQQKFGWTSQMVLKIGRTGLFLDFRVGRSNWHFRQPWKKQFGGFNWKQRLAVERIQIGLCIRFWEMCKNRF